LKSKAKEPKAVKRAGKVRARRVRMEDIVGDGCFEMVTRIWNCGH
jgi:hypothetical protein